MLGRGVKSTSNVIKVIWLNSWVLVVMIAPVFNVIPNAGGERVKMWADRHFLGRI